MALLMVRVSRCAYLCQGIEPVSLGYRLIMFCIINVPVIAEDTSVDKGSYPNLSVRNRVEEYRRHSSGS